jgi:hypothetical protein
MPLPIVWSGTVWSRAVWSGAVWGRASWRSSAPPGRRIDGGGEPVSFAPSWDGPTGPTAEPIPEQVEGRSKPARSRQDNGEEAP